MSAKTLTAQITVRMSRAELIELARKQLTAQGIDLPGGTTGGLWPDYGEPEGGEDLPCYQPWSVEIRFEVVTRHEAHAEIDQAL